MEFNNETSQLLAVLRRRHNQLEQAYQELEQYARSLEAGQQNLREQLAESQQELRNWQANQGVRLGRTLSLLGGNLRQNLALTSGLITHNFKHSIEAQLDLPQPGVTVSGELVVSGWATSSSSSTMQIEVWLNDIRLGLAEYQIERWDVINSRPWQTQLACGFAGRFGLDPIRFKAGPAMLKVRFADDTANNHEISCLLNIVPAETSENERLYQDWLERTAMFGWDFLAQRAASQHWDYQPRLSLLLDLAIVTSPASLAALLESVLAQTYPYWEFRLHIPSNISSELRQNIEAYIKQDNRIQIAATSLTAGLNNLLELCQGEFLALPEPDALLSQDAFFQVARFLNSHSAVTLLYSDEDFLNQVGQRSQPQFKPDWSPELFYSRPYTGQLTFYRVAAVREAGGFRPGLAEAQGYDLTLRLVEQNTQPHHLPEVIYHSRRPLKLDQPLSPAFTRVLEEHFERIKRPATVEPGLLAGTLHCRFSLAQTPSISLIIPTRDQSEVLRRCLDSILERTRYSNYEIVVVDNASHQSETHRYFAELSANSHVRLLSFEGPFNYAAINNFAATQVKSELLVFLNNDTEVITPGWLEELASYAVQPVIGAVGARLLYPDGTVQHAGVVVGLLGVGDHVLKELPGTSPGYLGLAKTVKNVSALTAACLMTRRELFEQVGGFDEKNLPVAFNDVDFCLKVGELGKRLVWTPYAELYHYESVSRGLDVSIEKENRLHQEISYMFGRWPNPIANDPYYNPNLSRDRLDYSVTSRFPQALKGIYTPKEAGFR